MPFVLCSVTNLLHDPEAVLVVAVNDILVDEREDWHDNVDDGLGRVTSHLSDQEKCLAVRLRVLRHCNTKAIQQ